MLTIIIIILIIILIIIIIIIIVIIILILQEMHGALACALAGIEEERLKEELRKIVACTTAEQSTALDRISDAGSVVPLNMRRGSMGR